jgi:DNA-binding transcriptional MerR regulator
LAKLAVIGWVASLDIKSKELSYNGFMKKQQLRTNEVARAAGVHANTVRIYESWGYLSPVPRAANGYRIFDGRHVEQVRLVRQMSHFTWLGGAIRKAGIAILLAVGAEQYDQAYQLAKELEVLVKEERRLAEEAVSALEHWLDDQDLEGASMEKLSIGQAAKRLDITQDALRNWERNGLVDVPRHPRTGYRVYTDREMRRLIVIRALRSSRYSFMAILRMLLAVDSGYSKDVRHLLDTPDPEEDVYMATDHWLSALTGLEITIQKVFDQINFLIAEWSN